LSRSLNQLNQFFEALENSPKGSVFNPWFESDPSNDIGQEAPIIRKKQLEQYLKERITTKTTLLLAEAIGYQGGHFSGIPMTSERILLGKLEHKSITPDLVFTGITPKRTSKTSLKPEGFTEPTATVVWGYLVDSGLNTRDFILWNAFPWHPYKKEKGMLSNRTPKEVEVTLGLNVLHLLLSITNTTQIIAVGEKSKVLLEAAGIDAMAVRHPANGGVPKFRSQLNTIFGIKK